MKKILLNIVTVTIPAFLLLILFLEFVFFRFFLPASDYPLSFYDHKYNVMRFLENCEGIHRKGREIKAHFRINASGWNSISDFKKEKTKGKVRIAVIGDSYVEALQVNVEDSFPSIIEKKLLTEGYKIEVYQFGYSGAALSQYLQMMRYVVPMYQPDILLFHIVHNDIHESIFEMKPVHFFLEFKKGEDGRWIELSPKPYEPSPKKRFLFKSAIVRFLYFNLYLSERIPALYSLFKKKERKYYEANVDLSRIKDTKMLDSITSHIFNEYSILAKRYNTKIGLVMDGPRAAIYAGKDPKETEAYVLNEIVRKNAEKLGLPLLDMTEIFINDYNKHHKRFEENIDWHYNQYGHRIVGEAASSFLIRLGWIEK